MIDCRDLGTLPVAEAASLQRTYVERRRSGAIEDIVLLVQHPPTYTIGRTGSLEHVLIAETERSRRGIDLLHLDRGGDVTYHDPGQAIAYPIIDLRLRGGDIHRYLRDLEAAILETLGVFGVAGETDGRYTGVWLGTRKVAQIGVKVSGGVTSHGVAINVSSDLANWSGIIPCGIRERGIVNLDQIVGPHVTVGEVRLVLATHLCARLAQHLQVLRS
ncbi:MAG: lipoyl(octanoyl) transferase LipB [Chloroflexi bacterium]|nr:lipoyl(octanoyl) transferase LipB [Chloroflexota bacterium]